MDSTEARDEDQVFAKKPISETLKILDNTAKLKNSSQRAGKNSHKISGELTRAMKYSTNQEVGTTDPNIMMVDQLWLWIIDEGTDLACNYQL
jgi:hypothetical protein